jgi:hypothetical protein
MLVLAWLPDAALSLICFYVGTQMDAIEFAILFNQSRLCTYLF